MRAQHDAILIGIGTALADDPELTCRLPGMASRSPIRVVLDTNLRLPPGSRLARTARETPVWVVAGEAAPDTAERNLRAAGVDIVRIADAGTPDLPAVVATLAERGITRLMVEGGPSVAASFVRADLVDKAVIFHGDCTIGGDGIDALQGLPLAALTQSKALPVRSAGTIGCDRIETFSRAILAGHTIGT
jgi:diaminohydroxyphosphoribosylaminopyrimidine deaminase/5-amino-6-(5-phosphoribosylamino)uracil reductase